MNTKKYFDALHGLLYSVTATNAGGSRLDLDGAVEELLRDIQAAATAGGKILFIGNGGSAGIASHQAVDYWKNGGVPAMAFNDASLLTCVSNDFGYAQVFEKPIEMFARQHDILFAISSSGRSENILRGVRAAQAKGCKVVTFSGFDKSNPLRTLGNYNFYVASGSYGHVEIAHLALSHHVLDSLMESAGVQGPDKGLGDRFKDMLPVSRATREN